MKISKINLNYISRKTEDFPYFDPFKYRNPSFNANVDVYTHNESHQIYRNQMLSSSINAFKNEKSATNRAKTLQVIA